MAFVLLGGVGGAVIAGLYFSLSSMIAASGTPNVILGGIGGLLLGAAGGFCVSICIFAIILAAIWNTQFLNKILGINNE